MTDEVFKVFYTGLLYYYDKAKAETTAEINRAYFDAVQPVTDEEQSEFFQKIVNTFVYFPRVAELKEILPKKKPPEFRNTTLCWYCMDLGYIPYVKTEWHGSIQRIYDYVAQCPMCEAGRAWHNAPNYVRLFGQEALKEIQVQNRKRFSNLEEQVPKAKETFARLMKQIGKGTQL